LRHNSNLHAERQAQHLRPSTDGHSAIALSTMRPHQRAAELRRRIGYLSALAETSDALTAESANLRTWREQLEAQGFGRGDFPDVLTTDDKWFKATGRSPDEVLRELKSELPEAEQREEEQRIEVARLATGESSWDIRMALAWIRFRDVEQACRFLERRDAPVSLWREGLETDELEQRLSGGELRCTGVREGVRREINPADWARKGREGLRLMRDTDPYAARSGEKRAYAQLRLQRQAVQHAFPRDDKVSGKDGPVLAAARHFLDQVEGKVRWDKVWSAVAEARGEKEIADRQKERLQPQLWLTHGAKLHRGRPSNPK
jgi:hypothetical protein